MSRGERIFFFLIFQFISVAVFGVAAQSPSDDGEQRHHYYLEFIPAMAVMLLALIAAIFLTSYFTIYCRDSSSGDGSNLKHRPRPEIEAFPTFTYAEVKGYKMGKAALECAVCIEEFEEDETLRLIPKCAHVFHPECIDAWVEDHVTCPVCRADLTPQPGNDPIQPRGGREDDQQQNDDVPIRIECDEEQDWRSNFGNRLPWRSSTKLIRSHSTGHSMVLVRENSERYSLRLPEEVRKELMNRALIHKTESLGLSLTREEGNSKSEEHDEVGVLSIAPPFLFETAVNKISNGDAQNAIISVMSLESKAHQRDSNLADSNLSPV